MPALTELQMSRMQGTQEEHMMDTGHIMRFVEGGAKDAHNVTRPIWFKEPATQCGFSFVNQTDEVLGRSDVPTVDAKLRLPKDTVIAKWDRFRLTHRLGNLVDTQEFEIKGEPRLGPSGQVVDLMLAKHLIKDEDISNL